MSQTIKINNFSPPNILLDNLSLSQAAASGATSISLLNTNGLSLGDLVVVGQRGQDGCELVAIQSVTNATSVSLSSALTLSHSLGDPVTKVFGGQINIYRATDVSGVVPADTSFTSLGNAAILFSELATAYTDTGGSSSYWYKFTYYNVGTGSETSLADSGSIRGGGYGQYCSIDEIRREAGFRNSPYISDSEIDEKRQAAQDEINGALDEFYSTPLQPPINDFLRSITRRLAAGLLRQSQYSQISDPQVNGTNMYNAAQVDLQKLVQKNRVLVNKQGTPLDSPGASGGVEGWPNSSTQTTESSSGGAPRVFRMSDIQGQPMTQDASGNPVGNLYYGRKW